ncbi:DsbE family thiol:disulfide interchange protein [Aliikangiella sp. IMCC44653]
MSNFIKWLKVTLTLVVISGIISVFYWALRHDSSQLPSQLINKPAPQFEVAELLDENVIYSNQVFKGNISLVNVWASWCAACYVEHPYWNDYAQIEGLQIVGLNYNDKKDKALEFLETQGNAYDKIFFDHTGRVGIEFGVYGAPETYLIDPQGRVRYRHVGVVSPDVFKSDFMPLIEKIRRGF